VLNLRPGRHRRTFELMAAVQAFGAVVVHQFKHAFRVARPDARSALIPPMIMTPGHGAYPAGHAVQAHMQKTVLDQLFGFTANGSAHDLESVGQLQRLADRIGENRMVAGVHYPTDIAEGEKLGDVLGAYLVAAAKVGGTPLGWLWTQATQEV
jgi:hypothetical protein